MPDERHPVRVKPLLAEWTIYKKVSLYIHIYTGWPRKTRTAHVAQI